MRVLIFSGQNNTLQSAVALATACHAATTGLRVLVVGTGPTGLLGHLLGQSLPSHPVGIKPNLAAMELITLDEFGQRWKILCSDPKFGITARLREIGADELPSFPGMDEIAQLIVADRAGQIKEFDLLVFCGTTIDSILRGVTMRETIRWITRLITGLSRGPGASKGSQDAAILPASILNALSSAAIMQDLRVALERYTVWFDARFGTRIRLILPSEEMSLPYMRYVTNGLGLNSMKIDTIFFRGDEAEIDSTVRQKMGSMLSPLGTFTPAPATVEEWTKRGVDLYSKRSEGLNLPKKDESLQIPPKPIEQSEIRLYLPFLDPKALDVGYASEEVIVRLGEFRRFLLMQGMEKGGNLRAKIEGDTLRLWVEVG